MSTMSLPDLTLILGGAASGKSAYGEQMVNAAGRRKVYLATAQAFDTEMKEKIALHRQSRGVNWDTIEEPVDIAPVIRSQDAGSILFIDCATLWLTNILLSDRAIETECRAFLDALSDCPCPVVVVSNEVGAGIVPDNALSRRFRAAQGKLNQQLAAKADRVVAVMAGLPLTLKAADPS